MLFRSGGICGPDPASLLVARKCLQRETADTMESWPLDRSGFSAFVGAAINQPADRPRLERVLRYIFRPSLPLKHLSYRETTGQVSYSQPGAVAKIWPHASDFLAYVTPALCDGSVRLPSSKLIILNNNDFR